MQQKIAEVGNEIKELIFAEDDRACVESMNRIAHEIATIALDSFTGSLLRKALDIAIAVIEFAAELED